MLRELADQRLHQRGQTQRVLDARLRVHHPDLDGAEVGVRAHVVPQVGVVLDHSGRDHELDPLLVVGPVLVGRRDPDPREGTEDRRPASTPARSCRRARTASSPTAPAAPAGGPASRWRRGSPCRGRRPRRARASRRSAPGARRTAAPRSGRGSGGGRRSAGPPTSRTGACRPSRSRGPCPTPCPPPGGAACAAARRPRRCPRHGSVEISSTDSISSGLISPSVAGSSIDSIALTSSSVSASRIISSSSMPIV